MERVRRVAVSTVAVCHRGLYYKNVPPIKTWAWSSCWQQTGGGKLNSLRLIYWNSKILTKYFLLQVNNFFLIYRVDGYLHFDPKELLPQESPKQTILSDEIAI